ncbi:hypothetical protein [Sciscionella marina]|uniref:hypothetical protein n=1 Tax=Sciscionella marina TaxID=508770 RepID=UPI000373AB38|nr:hypothetical protein [Sciscionella marina]
MTLAMEDSDEVFTAWQRANLANAARRFGVLLAGPAVFGWRLRSIGAPVTTPDGTQRWLRVVSEYPDYATGEGWTGNADANTFTALAKPYVLDIDEWDDDGRRQRAELATRLPGTPVSGSEVVRDDVVLSEEWWVELRRTLQALRTAPTERVHLDQDRLTNRTQASLGVELPVRRWETVHGDVHWANLHAGPFGLLDWELWGRGPAGLDAASLYCHSLLVPELARRVWEVFADLLGSPDGRTAQLAAGARMLRRITISGDYPDLETPLRRHLAGLTDENAPR